MDNQSTDSVQPQLLQAMKEVGYVQKDGRNDHSKYRYLSEKAVKLAVQDALIKAEVMPTSVKFETLEDTWRAFGRPGRNGEPAREQNLIKLRCTIVFRDGSEFEGLGSSADVADKALMQAQTSALREAWKNVFIIPSGNDPEEKSPETERAPTQEATGSPGARVPESSKREPVDVLSEHSETRTDAQRDEILNLIGEGGAMTRAGAASYIREQFSCAPDGLSKAHAVIFIAHLKSLLNG